MRIFSQEAIPAAFLRSLVATFAAFLLPSRSTYVSAGKLALISMLFAGFFLFTGAYTFEGGGSHFTDWALAIVHGTTLRAEAAERDVGFPLLLILSGFPIWHSFIGITLIQAAFAVLMPVLVFVTLVRASPAIAFYTGLASIISLAPYTYMKWIYHDQAYLFFNLLAVALLVEFLWSGRFRTLIFFTLAALAASFSRSAGNALYPMLLAIAYVLVRGPLRPYIVSILIFALGVGIYGWHRYEIFDMRHQENIRRGMGMNAAYSTYVSLSHYGLRLSPDIGPNTKHLLEELRQQLNPSTRESALTNGIWKNPIPPEYLEKHVFAYSPDELVEKISAESNEDYFWLLYSVVPDNDQFYLRVAAEIARAHPWYIVKYSMRNLWHNLFDPGYAITRYNTMGFVKTGTAFIPEQQGWGARGQQEVTEYGARAAREMEYFQRKTQPAIIQKIFSVVQSLYVENFHRYVWITSVLIMVAWLGAFLRAVCWVIPRTKFCRAVIRTGTDKLTPLIIGVSAFLLYEILLTSVLTQPFYRYFHFTELYRLVIAGFGVAVMIGALSLVWPQRSAPIGASASQPKRQGVVSAIQKYDLIERYFGQRRPQWIALLLVVNAGLFAWWTSSIIANAWGAPPIEIVSATYGQSCRGVVTAPPAENAVREGNVTSAVREACVFNQCTFLVDNKRLGDPVPGCAKDFSVTYRCKGDQFPRTASIDAPATEKAVELDCYTPPPSAVRIVSATYGQSCSGYVPKTEAQNWVKEGNVTLRVQEACSSRNVKGDRCTFVVGNDHWGDPAQGCGKDFSVSYRCKNEQQTRSASIAPEAAGKTVELDCRAAPSAIRIVSATYGQSCKGFVPTSQSQNWVREGNVTERVREDCRGQNAADNRCTFLVDNNRWGDPAQGCGKDFSVSYQCKGDQQPRTASIDAEAAGKSVELDCSAPRQ